ncbi:MAG: DNA polymerase/3'-5' exonuclease PolX [Patescibacteria group bacterium]
MNNREIAQKFYEVADILEILGQNQFRVNAYRRAARTIESLPEDINELYKQNKLTEIPGIGRGLKEKIEELITTGRSKEIEALEQKAPKSVLELLSIEGLGPKKVKFLYKKLHIDSINDLIKLIKSHRLLKFKGWGEKSEINILQGIEQYKKFSERLPLGIALPIAEELAEKIKNIPGVKRVEICGSIRRRRETIGDLDLLAISAHPEKTINSFVHLPAIKQIKASGPTKANVVLKQGIEADLRVIKPESFGAAMNYFTGSKAHNIHIRKLGQARNLKINEYGVFKKEKSDKFKFLTGAEEVNVFKSVGLPYIPPEIREDEGEIELAKQNKLPRLIEDKDIKGDLHCHSEASDGADSIEELVAYAQKVMGYKYLAITDHTPSVGVTHGLDAKRVLEQIKKIDRLNKKLRNFRILKGMEVDIKANGQLDLPNEILKKLDVVIAAIHTGFKQPTEIMTERIIKAIRNPYVKILAHPTGRIINKRMPYNVDIEKVISEAKKLNKILELNAYWNRLDLNDVNLKLAKKMGLKIVINTDAHAKIELKNMRYGVMTARRGWIEAKDVINAWPLEKLLKFLKKT